jgi:hypothetical protein
MNNPDEQAGASPAPVPEVVERTGLAVVTAGDRIFPARGSAAVMGPLAPATVSYHFPVEIVVVGGGLAELAEQIFKDLREKFEDLG